MRPTALPAIVVVATATALLAGCSAPTTTAAVGVARPVCTEHSVPVHLSDSDPTVYKIIGWLCRGRPDRRRARTVHLLVSGLTYSHTYWSGYHTDTYSYVRAAANRGYTTFNIDRIGIGKSDHPPADQLTLQAHAHTIAQIITQLRDGTIGDTAFTTIVGVGHSLGAGILQYEAGTVRDPRLVPDLLILTGYLTKANPAVVAQIGAALHPITDDPNFVNTELPTGYLTTRRGTRHVFFDPANVDRGTIAMDEKWKQTSSLAERTTVGAARDPHITHAIAVPVLMLVGQTDRLACDPTHGLSCADDTAIINREAPNFSAKTCLTAHVIPDSGHAINLHRNAHVANNRANDWIDTYTVGTAGRRLPNDCE